MQLEVGNRLRKMLKQAAIDVVCLQEMHLKALEEKCLHQIFQGHMYHARACAHCSGVYAGYPVSSVVETRRFFLDTEERYIKPTPEYPDRCLCPKWPIEGIGTSYLLGRLVFLH